MSDLFLREARPLPTRGSGRLTAASVSPRSTRKTMGGKHNELLSCDAVRGHRGRTCRPNRESHPWKQIAQTCDDGGADAHESTRRCSISVGLMVGQLDERDNMQTESAMGQRASASRWTSDLEVFLSADTQNDRAGHGRLETERDSST